MRVATPVYWTLEIRQTITASMYSIRKPTIGEIWQITYRAKSSSLKKKKFKIEFPSIANYYKGKLFFAVGKYQFNCSENEQNYSSNEKKISKLCRTCIWKRR